MRKTILVIVTVACASVVLAQDRADFDAGGPTPSPSSSASRGSSELPKFGIAVGVSTLGLGIQAATAVSRSENLRFGFNYFPYDQDFKSGITYHYDKDGISYKGGLKLRSAEFLFDQYVGRFFHISSGVMFYDGNEANATATVAGGQPFSLGGSTYYSDASSPVVGTGHIAARKAAPEVLIGFGNLLPRNNHHFTANVEFGVVFQGSPSASLQLSGSTCASPGTGCINMASNSAIQTSIQAEQAKLNGDLAVFKYYPVVRLTFGYKF